MGDTKALAKKSKKAAKEPDWALIGKEYIAGIKSNVLIGAEFGISESLVRKKAKQFGWQKNLGDAIRERALALLQDQSVREIERDSVRAEISDIEIIEDNAQIQVNVIRSHRTDIGRYRSLCELLLSEIELQTGSRISFEELGELMHSPDDKGRDQLNEVYKKIISNPVRVDSVKKLVDTLKTLIALEREAFSIDAKEPIQQSKTDIDFVNQKLTELLEKANNL